VGAFDAATGESTFRAGIPGVEEATEAKVEIRGNLSDEHAR
jgi:hypothetical protein